MIPVALDIPVMGMDDSCSIGYSCDGYARILILQKFLGVRMQWRIVSEYSGPSLSGHSQQRPPSLIRPQIYATTINYLPFLLTKGHLSNVGTIS